MASSNKKLMRLQDLCVAFHDAVKGKMDRTPELEEKRVALITPALEAKLNKMLDKMISLVEDSNLDDPYSDEEVVKLALLINDHLTGPLIRVMSKSKLAEYFPSGLKNQEDADLLRSMGAKNMAKLSEFKPKKPKI